MLAGDGDAGLLPPTTPCPPTRGPSQRSATMSSTSGDAPRPAQPEGQDVMDRHGQTGQSLAAQAPDIPPPGPLNASASNTQGGSRMRECRTYGSVRGARSNARPYRD